MGKTDTGTNNLLPSIRAVYIGEMGQFIMRRQALQAESIECKNEMDPFPHLIDLSQNKCIYIETFTLFKTADKFVFK